MRPEVESARRDWEDAHRRLTEAARDATDAEALHAQVDAVSEEPPPLFRREIGMEDDGHSIPKRRRFSHSDLRLMPRSAAARPW